MRVPVRRPDRRSRAAPRARRRGAPGTHGALRTAALLAVLTLLCTIGTPARSEQPVFRDPFDGRPIDVPEAKTKTPALEHFKRTGENRYRDEASALRDGKALYEQWCQVCHDSDGSGKMCPALIGSDHIYPQTADDAGMFAILYVGASGAMQSFAGRLSQDEMLRVIAYVRTLGK